MNVATASATELAPVRSAVHVVSPYTASGPTDTAAHAADTVAIGQQTPAAVAGPPSPVPQAAHGVASHWRITAGVIMGVTGALALGGYVPPSIAQPPSVSQQSQADKPASVTTQKIPTYVDQTLAGDAVQITHEFKWAGPGSTIPPEEIQAYVEAHELKAEIDGLARDEINVNDKMPSGPLLEDRVLNSPVDNLEQVYLRLDKDTNAVYSFEGRRTDGTAEYEMYSVARASTGIRHVASSVALSVGGGMRSVGIPGGLELVNWGISHGLDGIAEWRYSKTDVTDPHKSVRQNVTFKADGSLTYEVTEVTEVSGVRSSLPPLWD